LSLHRAVRDYLEHGSSDRLLRAVRDALVTHLGAARGWAFAAADIPAALAALLRDRSFLPLFEMPTDPRLTWLLAQSDADFHQAAALLLRVGDVPFALFYLTARPPDQIGYLRLEQAARLLNDAGRALAATKKPEAPGASGQVAQRAAA